MIERTHLITKRSLSAQGISRDKYLEQKKIQGPNKKKQTKLKRNFKPKKLKVLIQI